MQYHPWIQGTELSIFYHPVSYSGRHFSKDIEYSAIDWGKLSSIVNAFKSGISEWYILPAKILAKGWPNSFSVAVLGCLLILWIST